MTILLLFLVPIMFKYLGVKDHEVYSAQTIFDRVSIIMQRILNIHNEIQDVNSPNDPDIRLNPDPPTPSPSSPTPSPNNSNDGSIDPSKYEL